MAELGVAASAISVASIAIQVGDSIIKLKDFWNHVKEAPEEIKWLMEEIQNLGLVLSGVESSKAHNDPLHLEPAFANRCLELCRKGASILEAVVKEADEEIRKRRKVGGVKAVLKKGTIERLKERLRSSQLMLMLSNQAYSEYVSLFLIHMYQSLTNVGDAEHSKSNGTNYSENGQSFTNESLMSSGQV